MTEELEPHSMADRSDVSPPDGELARRWQQGDHRAAEQLIDRHLSKLRAFLAVRCGDRTEADDLVQEIFAAVCRKIDTYRPELPFTGWLYGIARNKMVDFWRRQRPQEPFEAHHGAADERSPLWIYEQSESAANVWREVFKLLPEAQANALWLRVQEELPVEQIALALDTTLSNAKVLLFRARKTLAAHPKFRTRQ